MRLSLSNRLAVVFFAITALAIGALYLYVAPGLQSRLMGEKLTALANTARSHSGKLSHAVGSSTPLPDVRKLVNQTAGISGNRVTLLSVNVVQGSNQFSRLADSGMGSAPALGFGTANRAVTQRRLVTGVEGSGPGAVAVAARPVSYFHGAVGWVIVYSAPLADVVRTVSTVRHEILVAGAIALLLALIAGYLVARAGPAGQAAGAGGQAGRRRRLQPPHPGRLHRRAGPTRGRLQRDAAAAPATRAGAQEVHRHRVA